MLRAYLAVTGWIMVAGLGVREEPAVTLWDLPGQVAIQSWSLAEPSEGATEDSMLFLTVPMAAEVWHPETTHHLCVYISRRGSLDGSKHGSQGGFPIWTLLSRLVPLSDKKKTHKRKLLGPVALGRRTQESKGGRKS